jgi:hypothetical protein
MARRLKGGQRQLKSTHRRSDGRRAAPLVYDAEVGRTMIDGGVVLQPVVVDIVRRVLRGGQQTTADRNRNCLAS